MPSLEAKPHTVFPTPIRAPAHFQIIGKKSSTDAPRILCHGTAVHGCGQRFRGGGFQMGHHDQAVLVRERREGQGIAADRHIIMQLWQRLVAVHLGSAQPRKMFQAAANPGAFKAMQKGPGGAGNGGGIAAGGAIPDACAFCSIKQISHGGKIHIESEHLETRPPKPPPGFTCACATLIPKSPKARRLAHPRP